MPIPKTITECKLLLVEGSDEVAVFDRLLDHINVRGVQTIDVGGKDKFPKMVPALKVRPGFNQVEKIGFTRDADDSQKTAFESLCGVLTAAGFPKPPDDGMFSTGDLSVGVFILPNNATSGVLEELLIESVRETDAFICVDEFASCVSKLNSPPKNLSKSKAQAFMAAMTEESRSVGVGAQKKYWNFEAPWFEPLRKFLLNFK